MRKVRCILLIVILLSPTFFISISAEESTSTTISAEKYKEGYRYNTHGWIYLHIEGDPYERGYQHGYLLSEEIADQIHRLQNIFPYKWSWRILRFNAMRLFWRK